VVIVGVRGRRVWVVFGSEGGWLGRWTGGGVGHHGRRRSRSGWLCSSEVREWRGELVSVVVGGEGARSRVVVVMGGSE
jgi:hypothetical protein